MCRHTAYLGPAATVATLLCDPPFGLLRQSWAPRRQRHGTVNADGFGFGWYAAGHPWPARYRRAEPMWADESFAELGRVTSTCALMAAVRSATPGAAQDPSAAAPYRSGRWLFSHNGVVEGWPDSVAELAGELPPGALLNLEARCDSALLWALTLARLRGGQSMAAAVATTVAAVSHHTTGRFNLLLTDGESVVASAHGDTLFYRGGVRHGQRWVVVASEPDDDAADWVEVPDRSLVVVDRGRVRVASLPAGSVPATPLRSSS